MDVPLLFEIGGEKRVDAVCVVSAPGFIQARRVLARPGMTAEKLAQIRARQMPDALKRRRADIVIPTGLSKGLTWWCVGSAVREFSGCHGHIWPPR